MQHNGNRQGAFSKDDDLRENLHGALGAVARVQGSESDEADTSLPQHSTLRAAAKTLVSAINVAVDELERVVPLELNT